MPKPKRQRVGAFEYTVVWDDKLGDLGAAGMTSADNAMIGIDPRLSDTMQGDTLVHETLHAAWKQTPLGISYPDIDKDSPGEVIIQAVSPIIYSWIRDNKAVISWLQSL